jgi:D-glycerate 3-kinase
VLLTSLWADYPAYELFSDTLRAGIFGDEKGRQLRILVDEERRVKEAVTI